MALDLYFAEKLKSLAAFGSIEQAMSNPETAKQIAAAFRDDNLGPRPDGDVRDDIVEGRSGPIGIRIYHPAPARSAPPAFVWVHGGGFAGGSIDMPESDTVARELAFLHQVLVITVDYSLSNGSTVTYPIPHRQVVDVIRWVRHHNEELGYAPDRLAVGGASAGANLTVGAVLELRDQGEELPGALVLVYPMLHRKLLVDPAIEGDLASALGATRMNQGLVDHMFGLYTANADAPYASVEDHELAGLLPTLTIVSEYDDLRPSGESFHRELLAAGVTAELQIAAGMPHGHLDRTRLVPEVCHTVNEIAAYLTRF